MRIEVMGGCVTAVYLKDRLLTQGKDYEVIDYD